MERATRVCSWACLAGLALGATACGMVVGPDGDGGADAPGGTDGDATRDTHDGTTAPTRRGVVAIASRVALGAPQRDFSAGFYAQPAAMQPGCTLRTVGPCEVRVCTDVRDLTLDDFDPFVGSEPRSAGAIVARAGSGLTAQLVPTANGIYPVVRQAGPAPVGESIAFTAEGAEVPAFEGAVVFPPAVRVLEPARGAEFTVDETTPLVVRWEPFAGAEVLLQFGYLRSGPGTASGTGVRCTFASAAGEGTLPAAALASLPPGEGTVLNVDSVARTELDAGGYAVTLMAFTGTSYMRITRP